MCLSTKHMYIKIAVACANFATYPFLIGGIVGVYGVEP